MKGSLGGGRGVSTDLLACFPSIPHLPLMPKTICGPSRHTESGRRPPARHTSRGRASPLFKAKDKHLNSVELDEPASPKVTCAGQIKVRAKARPTPRRSGGGGGGGCDRNWLEMFGLKKDAMHFLGALRGLRFGARCFGSFRAPADCTSDEEDDDEAEREDNRQLQEAVEVESNGRCQVESMAPPPNALLLTRCRSAPATRWSPRGGGGGDGEVEGVVLTNCARGFPKVSSEIAKETRVEVRMNLPARSRSWKR
ncbi:hypothetical protein OPV22_032104 [Ensete ventricosum]|uniref:DUF3741 domain-containing protein n=1 Tax=Ensete ventricosum TaxID=4639 RepID=A0AAV8PQM6_ENSVE|nr:hypothetical protein OPV22_032104 [Ensete ventricosum]